jgi:hypothetical protein
MWPKLGRREPMNAATAVAEGSALLSPPALSLAGPAAPLSNSAVCRPSPPLPTSARGRRWSAMAGRVPATAAVAAKVQKGGPLVAVRLTPVVSQSVRASDQ